MRLISEHQINPVNDKLRIAVTDEPGPGGANHRYEISGFDPFQNPSIALDGSDRIDPDRQVLLFQNGAVNEVGVNGVTHEALLAIVADRLRSFQAGPYAGRENALAITKIEEALHWLHSRTRGRMARGVEGTMAK